MQLTPPLKLKLLYTSSRSFLPLSLNKLTPGHTPDTQGIYPAPTSLHLSSEIAYFHDESTVTDSAQL